MTVLWCRCDRLFLSVLIHDLPDILRSVFRHPPTGFEGLGIHVKYFREKEAVALRESLRKLGSFGLWLPCLNFDNFEEEDVEREVGISRIHGYG